MLEMVFTLPQFNLTLTLITHTAFADFINKSVKKSRKPDTIRYNLHVNASCVYNPL